MSMIDDIASGLYDDMLEAGRPGMSSEEINRSRAALAHEVSDSNRRMATSNDPVSHLTDNERRWRAEMELHRAQIRLRRSQRLAEEEFMRNNAQRVVSPVVRPSDLMLNMPEVERIMQQEGVTAGQPVVRNSDQEDANRVMTTIHAQIAEEEASRLALADPNNRGLTIAEIDERNRIAIQDWDEVARRQLADNGRSSPDGFISNTAVDRQRAYDRGFDAGRKSAVSGEPSGMAVGMASRKLGEVVKLAVELADLTLGRRDADAKSLGLAAAIVGLASETRVKPVVQANGKRVRAVDLLVSGIYVGHQGDRSFDWEYLGEMPGEPKKFRLRREGQQATVEFLLDHGLTDGGDGKNWTEFSGLTSDDGRRIADSMDIEADLPVEE